MPRQYEKLVYILRLGIIQFGYGPVADRGDRYLRGGLTVFKHSLVLPCHLDDNLRREGEHQARGLAIDIGGQRSRFGPNKHVDGVIRVGETATGTAAAITTTTRQGRGKQRQAKQLTDQKQSRTHG